MKQKTKKNSPWKQKLKVIGWLFKNASQVARYYLIVNSLYSILTAIASFTIIVFPKLIVDELSDEQRPRVLVIFVIGFIIINLFISGLRAIFQSILDKQNFRISSHLNKLIFEKTMSTDYKNIEDAKLLNQREFAINNINQSGGVDALLRCFWRIITNLITIVGLLYIIFTSSIYVPVAIIIFKMLTMLLDGYIQKQNYKLNEKNSENNKLFSYLLYLNSDYKYAKETRIYHMAGLFEEKFKNFVINSTKLFRKMAKNDFYYSVVTFTLSMLLIFLIAFILSMKHINNPQGFTIGSFLMAINALISFESKVGILFQDIVSIDYKSKLYQTIICYLGIKDNSDTQEDLLPDEEPAVIEFEHVTFKYAGCKEAVLNDINCRFDRNCKVAIVGENGAGKTTLIKLMLRLYEPDEGRILLNGVDIRTYNRKEYYKLFSVVFQDFEIFSYPVDENIACCKKPQDSVKLWKAVKESGSTICLEKEKNGLHTAVTSYFDKEGINFSGGELQHLAIARAVYKDAPIVIMDEPTAALDPVAEEEIFLKLDQLSRDKMAVYISHRLSSCRFCDWILVLEQGQLIQSGTHELLIQDKQGKYAQLFQAQANFFVTQN